MDGAVIIEGRKRRSWPAALKRQIVEESCDPDVTVCAVARRYDVDPAQLFVWRKKFLPPVEPAPRFLSVDVMPERDPAAPSPPERIEVVLTNGRRLFVPTTIEPKQLGRLVRTLDH